MASPEINDLAFWIPTIISIIAVILFYVDMRWRLKQDHDASKSMLNLIQLMSHEHKLFREERSLGRLSNESLAQQKLLQEQQKLQLRQTLATIQGIKWLADIAKMFSDNE